MALLNGIYIHVIDEEITKDTEITEHPIEQGADITDHVNIKGFVLNLSGKIVDVNDTKAADILRQVENWQYNKTLVNYLGRNYAGNMLIKSISRKHPNTVSGGLEFDMELKEIKTAKSSFIENSSSDSGSATVQTPVTQVQIEVGAIVVFKGGDVYVSSDAKNKAATRGRSTCEITIISNKDWSIHPLHLISTDGGNVYGWVDRDKIEDTAATPIKGQTYVGTQQIVNR